MVTLPPYQEELPIVLPQHASLPLEQRPVFWYRQPEPEELAKYADDGVVRIVHRASNEVEERRSGAQMILVLLFRHLTRIERLFEQDGTTPITLPPLEATGRITPERKRVIARLPADWRLELCEAIAETRDSRPLLKN